MTTTTDDVWRPHQRLPHDIAALITTAYLLTWGTGTIRAILLLKGKYRSPDDGTPHGWVDTWLTSRGASLLLDLALLVMCLVALLATGQARTAFARPRSRGAWTREAKAVVLWTLSYLAGVITATTLTPDRGYPYPDPSRYTTAQITYHLIESPFSGALEELWFGPVLLGIALRSRHRIPVPVMILIAGLLRGSFHLYYGASSWGFFLWGAGAAATYMLTRRWIGPFILHALVDIGATANGLRLTDTIADLALLLILALFLAAIAYLAHDARLTRRARGHRPTKESPA